MATVVYLKICEYLNQTFMEDVDVACNDFARKRMTVIELI